ncbi:hypothetical protein VOLCADRAFT_40665, partial [Volvox carteri f. nagariensis]
LQVEPAVQGDGGRRPSLSPVYRHVWSQDGFPRAPFGAATSYDLWRNSVQRQGPAPCLAWRIATQDGKPGPFISISYDETERQVELLSAGLAAAAGLRAGERVAVYAANCPEWMLVLQACNRMNYVCVPVYDTLGRDAVQYVVNHSGRTCSSSSSGTIAAIASSASHEANSVAVTDGEVKDAMRPRVRCTTYTELLELGMRAGAVPPPQPPRPRDLTTIMYTSGTTGEPKGVQLPHSAVVATIASLAAALEHYNEQVRPGDSMLSYLPLAHIFDRVSEETCLAAGGCIGYWSGDVTRVGEDAVAFKPTVFIGVPRVYDKFFETVQERLAQVHWLRRSIFQAMYDRKLAVLRGGARPDAATLRLIVFGRVRRGLGGRLRLVVSGGAPLSYRVEEFLRVTLGCPVSQGYGLTETCAASFLQNPYDCAQAGSVGPPLLCTEFRLRSVPDMGYLAEGGGEMSQMPAGELLLRGPQLFTGMYEEEEEVHDPRRGRWFCTGDIATLRPDGSLEIVDRIKNMFKLSQGEYISPEHLEAVYGEAPVVEQIWVYGDSRKPFLVAVVVPKLREVLPLAGKMEIIAPGAPAAAAAAAAAAKAIGRVNHLRGFEIVRAVHLVPEPFSPDNGLMTATLKLRRPMLLRRYRREVDEMYEQ